MKFYYNIIFILICGFLLSAPVNIDMARAVAKGFYNSVGANRYAGELAIHSHELIEHDFIKAIYLFHLDPEGFILMSADDRSNPILGYSFESAFVMEDMPSNISWMIDAYKEMIINVIESDQSATEKINTEWQKYFTGNGINSRTRDIVGPLLESKFDQIGGWNDYCPSSCEGGDEVPNGCVALSMATIMHYWSYPSVGQGSNSCNCGGFGTQTVDFSGAYYDYSAMGDAITATDAAAYLLWHTGISVNMDYDCEGSGAQVNGGYPSAEYALENYFLYKDADYLQRTGYSINEFVELLKAELDNNRPFIYAGYNEDGGHAWICDGYDDEMFHMNWGWGGQSNGWFTVTGPDDPDGWGSGSHILIGIEPQSLNRPNLKFTGYSANEISGDGDAVINPGETFEIIIELANPAPWPAASSIEVLFSTEDEGVSIDDNTSSFISLETLESGETFSSSSTPIVINVDGDITLDKKTINLMVTGVGIEGAADNDFSKEYELEVLVSLNQYGFPVYEASQKSSPLAIDFDNDGDKEIIYGDFNGFVHIYNSDGTEIVDDNFPFNTGDQIWGAVAGADMDGDGLVDIAVASKSQHLYIFDKNGLKTDFNANKFLIGTPAIGNLDDDADLEVVFSGYSSGNVIWALNADGSAVDGFPVGLGEKVKIGVALADFNGNGKDDIVVGTVSDYIHLIYDDGSEAPGFPYQVGDKIQSAPSILDVDGQKVIFVGSNDNNLYAVNNDGSLRFSVGATNNVLNSPAFLKHNNTFYVFFSDESGILYAVDTDGNALSGWPVDTGAGKISKSVAFSDLNNDGTAEVIAVTDLTDILAYNLDGTLHEGFPMNDEFGFTTAPMVMDMDGDGDLEILGGSEASFVAIDVKYSGSSSGYWSMYRGNAERTGYYDISSLSNTKLYQPNKYKLNLLYPNPFNPKTTIYFSIKQSGHVLIEAYDIRGRLVDKIISSFQTPGNHSITWNASAYPSGVYFVSMEAGRFREVRKVLLIK